MSIIDVARQVEAVDLAHGRQMIETTLEGWELLTWNELLAPEVVLSLKLGALDASRLGELDAAGGNLEAAGRDEAKDVLRAIYSDLRKDLIVTTKLVSGYEAILLGSLAVRKADQEHDTLPVGVYMAFNPHGKIQKMTIAAVDLQATVDAMRNAARNGAAGQS